MRTLSPPTRVFCSTPTLQATQAMCCLTLQTGSLAHASSSSGSHDYSLAQFGLTREYIADRLPEVFDSYGFAR